MERDLWHLRTWCEIETARIIEDIRKAPGQLLQQERKIIAGKWGVFVSNAVVPVLKQGLPEINKLNGLLGDLADIFQEDSVKPPVCFQCDAAQKVDALASALANFIRGSRQGGAL
jgi:hypothetical protein